MSRLLEVCPDFGGAYVFTRGDLERVDEDIDGLVTASNRAFGRIKVLEARVDALEKIDRRREADVQKMYKDFLELSAALRSAVKKCRPVVALRAVSRRASSVGCAARQKFQNRNNSPAGGEVTTA